ncbi:MAG: hypothetical protein WD004_04090 [Actinomycetota bacterium]
MSQFYSTGGPPTLILDGPVTGNGWRAFPLVSVREGNNVIITAVSDGGHVIRFGLKGTKPTEVLHLIGRKGAAGTSFFNGNVNYDLTFYVPHADCYSFTVTWTGTTEGTDSALVAIGSRPE